MSGCRDSIEARVKRLIGEQLGISSSELKGEWTFAKDMGADSLDEIELLMAAEEDFDIEIPDEIFGETSTVQQAIDYIRQRTAFPAQVPASPGGEN